MNVERGTWNEDNEERGTMNVERGTWNEDNEER